MQVAVAPAVGLLRRHFFLRSVANALRLTRIPVQIALHGFWTLVFVIACLTTAPLAASALDSSVLKQLVAEDSDAKLEAVNKIVSAGDPAALPIFQAMLNDALFVFGGRLIIVADGNAKDALTGEPVNVPADKLEAVGITIVFAELSTARSQRSNSSLRTAESDSPQQRRSPMTRARKCCRLSKEHWQRNPIDR